MSIENISALEEEIKKNIKLISVVNDFNDEESSLKNKVSLNETYIKNENELSKFPPQAFGSIKLYNKLNENYSIYEKDQFNKITRFVSHIEDKEKRYRKLYLKCTTDYHKTHNIPISELSSTKKELKICYKLLIVLATEVSGDLVSFNKVFNKIEDVGLFMSLPEKREQEYLMQISNKLSDINKGLKVIFKQLEENNSLLKEIEISSSNSADLLDVVSSSLFDISYNLE